MDLTWNFAANFFAPFLQGRRVEGQSDEEVKRVLCSLSRDPLSQTRYNLLVTPSKPLILSFKVFSNKTSLSLRKYAM